MIAALTPKTPPPAPAPALTLNPDVAIEILLKARLFDVKVPQTDPDSGSNASDDDSVDALEFGAGDDTRHELVSAISDLNDDEQQDLIALVMVGRGDFTLDDWAEARQTAAGIGRARTPRYITDSPRVSDYLEEGLSRFNHSVGDYLDRH
tara:strand:- start:3192 stop:3641 length:450 start_codon:yes stop_codon:yes gene_type:complete